MSTFTLYARAFSAQPPLLRHSGSPVLTHAGRASAQPSVDRSACTVPAASPRSCTQRGQVAVDCRPTTQGEGDACRAARTPLDGLEHELLHQSVAQPTAVRAKQHAPAETSRVSACSTGHLRHDLTSFAAARSAALLLSRRVASSAAGVSGSSRLIANCFSFVVVTISPGPFRRMTADRPGMIR